LQELDQGELDGQRALEMIDRYPTFFANWATDPEHARVPGGETLGECRDRAVGCVVALAAQHPPGPPVVIVTHQMVMATLVLNALGRPLRDFRKVTHKNVAVSLLGWSQETGMVLHAFNDTAHVNRLNQRSGG
jgi:broad specificity phosphatase PhoE